jgi:endonuclease-3
LTAKPKTAAERKARLDKILSLLDVMYPNVTCELHHETAWQLLVATILSAQCTDKRVNMVTALPNIQRYMTSCGEPEEPAGISPPLLQQGEVHHLRAKRVDAEFGGEVRHHEEMLTIPGAARKTPNVVPTWRDREWPRGGYVCPAHSRWLI